METRYKYKNFRECVILLQKLFQSDYRENFPTSNSYSYPIFHPVSINPYKKKIIKFKSKVKIKRRRRKTITFPSKNTTEATLRRIRRKATGSNRSHPCLLLKRITKQSDMNGYGGGEREESWEERRKSNVNDDVAEEFSADLIIRTFEDLPGPQYLSVNVYRGGN